MAYCSADGCYRTTSCGPYCRDNGNLDKEPAPMTTITDAHRAALAKHGLRIVGEEG